MHTYSATGTLLDTETTGALFPTIDRALRELGRHARAPTTHDSTRYGLSRSSPRTFLAHHRAAISAAIVLADASRQQPFFFLELLGRTRHGLMSFPLIQYCGPSLSSLMAVALIR